MTISWLCVCDVTNHIVSKMSRDDGNAENDLLVGFQDGNVDCDDCDFHDNVDDIRTKRAELMLHICDVLRLDVLNTANLCPAVSVVGLFYLLTTYVCLVSNSGPF